MTPAILSYSVYRLEHNIVRFAMLWLPKTNQCTFFIQFAATNDTCKWIFQRAKNATENGYAYEECIRCYIIYNHIEYLLANTADIEENRSEAKLSVN